LKTNFSFGIFLEVNPSIGSLKSQNSAISRSEIFTFLLDLAKEFAPQK
jgi:hypothetical protein